MTQSTKTREDAGFSLIELLVVVAILGMLAAIAIPTFLAQRSKAANATAVSDLRNAATAEEAQLGDSGTYVTNVSLLNAQGFRLSPNTQIGIAATSAGYCEVAGQAGHYYWFDSSAGGVQKSATTSLVPPTTANGICSTTVPSQLS